LKTESELIAAAKMLQEMGARNVLISRAGDGALLLDENGGILRCKAPRGTVVNSVGAGDSMVAGFLTGWLETGDYGTALRMGIAAGSATAFSLGLADRQMVERLQKKMI
jgi:1-phosphofructokinase